jgi:hypothetical protein
MRNLQSKVPADVWPEFHARAQACYQPASPALAAALAHDPWIPRFIRDVGVVRTGADDLMVATILAPCRLTITLFQPVAGRLASEVLANRDVEPGRFEQTVEGTYFVNGNSLLLTANDEEYHLHPFLNPA